MRKVILAAIMALGCIGSSSATVLDFSSASSGRFTSLSVGDYVLNYTFGDRPAVATVNNQQVLVDSNPLNLFGANFTLSRLDGLAFTLLSVDVGGTGRFDIGDTTVYNLGLGSGYTTISPAGTSNVTSIPIDIVSVVSNARIASLNVQEVPEPMSLAMLGAGLVGAGAMRRRIAR